MFDKVEIRWGGGGGGGGGGVVGLPMQPCSISILIQ